MQLDLSAYLKSLEEKLFEPAVRNSRSALEALLSRDFREIGSSGRLYDFDETVRGLLQEEPDGTQRWLENFELKRLSDSIALATYYAFRRKADGTEMKSLRSSIWHREDDNVWRMIFHQGTVTR